MFKKVLVVLFASVLLLALNGISNAKKAGKEPDKPLTKIESYLAKKGHVVIKESYPIGSLYGKFDAEIEIEAMAVYKPGAKEASIKGLRITITSKGRIERSNISFLDIEEIKSLSKSLGYMKDLMSQWQGTNRPYTEVVFSTKDNFEIGFYQKGEKTGSFASNGYVGKTNCFFQRANHLSEIKDLIDKGQNILKPK